MGGPIHSPLPPHIGLLLWGVDLLQRASTSSANVAIHSVHLDEEKDVTTLVLQHARVGLPWWRGAVAGKGGHYSWEAHVQGGGGRRRPTSLKCMSELFNPPLCFG